MVVPGDPAPRFALADQTGAVVSLAELAGRAVFVYFYPKADTPGCTQQACGLNEILDRVGDTLVVGISPDPVARQARFAAKYSLSFPLLADEDHAVAEAYGVWQEKKNYGKTYMGVVRSAFLIDASGVVTHTWYKISPAKTPEVLLAEVAK